MWIELSEEKRKALRILIRGRCQSIEQIGKDIGVNKGSIFNKLRGTTKFKKYEYEMMLRHLGITDKQLDECSKSYILKLLP